MGVSDGSIQVLAIDHLDETIKAKSVPRPLDNPPIQSFESNQQNVLSSLTPRVIQSVTSIELSLISVYDRILLNVTIPNALMYLYTHPHSDIGWSNSCIKGVRRGKSLSSLFELRDEYLLKAPFHYPDTYRQNMWQILLHLPKSQKAYDSLLESIDVVFDKDLLLGDPFLNRRMTMLLQGIANWCPELKDVSFEYC